MVRKGSQGSSRSNQSLDPGPSQREPILTTATIESPPQSAHSVDSHASAGRCCAVIN